MNKSKLPWMQQTLSGGKQLIIDVQEIRANPEKYHGPTELE